MFVSEGHSTAGAMLIWATYTATWGQGNGDELASPLGEDADGNMSRSVILPQSDAVLLPMIHGATKGHKMPRV